MRLFAETSDYASWAICAKSFNYNLRVTVNFRKMFV